MVTRTSNNGPAAAAAAVAAVAAAAVDKTHASMTVQTAPLTVLYVRTTAATRRRPAEQRHQNG